MARETWVQSLSRVIPKTQKWYLIPPCLTLSIIRYGSMLKWRYPGKGVAPSPTPWCSSYQKGVFELPSTMFANFTLLSARGTWAKKLRKTYNEHNSLTSKHKITLDRVTWYLRFTFWTLNVKHTDNYFRLLLCFTHTSVFLQPWLAPSLTLLPDPLWPRVVVLVRIPSRGHIDKFKSYSYLIRLCSQKSSKIPKWGAMHELVLVSIYVFVRVGLIDWLILRTGLSDLGNFMPRI